MLHNSEVWQFFELNLVVTAHAECTIFKVSILRCWQGASPSLFMTSNMHKHLKNVQGELPNAMAAATSVSVPSTLSKVG